MKPKGIFTLDIGSTSAFAYGYPGDEPVWGHRTFTDTIPGGAPALLDAYARWLVDRFVACDPAYFCYEPMFVGKYFSAVRRLMWMEGIALSLAHRRGLKIRGYAIDKVAQFHGTAGLKSQAKKRVTRESIEQRFGWHPLAIDEADALAVWLYAESQLDPTSRRCVGPLFSPQREVIDSR